MRDKNIKEITKWIKFFQNNDYIERLSQISSFHNYDNYLEYYICEKLNPFMYIKARLKNQLSKHDAYHKQVDELLSSINVDKCVCVISPYYKELKYDGYCKRIEQIDREVLNDFTMIYLDYTNLGNRLFSINQIDQKHIVIKFNSFDEKHVEYIKRIIDSIKRVYIHSIHVLMPDILNYQLFDSIFDDNNKIVLDLHGAVPEELKEFDSDERAQLAKLIETISLNLSDKIICMSGAMVDYYAAEYSIELNKLIPVSIIPIKQTYAPEAKKHDDALTAVYAGGIQKWQNIDLIKESICLNKDRCKFKIFTHDSDALKQSWNDITCNNLTIDTKNNDEIYLEYKDCDFGFLLRDDTIVNNVACPTKLMEYLAFGIIPILKNENIGNFKKLGLNFVSIEDFNKGIIPDYDQRNTMIIDNYNIFLKIVRQSEDGIALIKEFFRSVTKN